MTGARVTLATLRQARAVPGSRLCLPGVRAAAEALGLDWDRFVREGIPADELEALGQDGLAADLVRLAREAHALEESR